MLDSVEYTIDGDSYQGNGHNGYDHLEGDWLTYYKVGKNFTRKVKPEDREDFLHDLLLAMAKVKASYTAKGKELTTGGLVRIAQYEVADYWRKWFKQHNGVSCHDCSKAQRDKCRELDLYGECPRAIKLDSLDRLIDGNGDSTPLYELIADDNAIDLVAMLDARFTLKGYPHKAVKLIYKRYAGYPLEEGERRYINRFRKRLQKTLI
jgi:hypothetical protein